MKQNIIISAGFLAIIFAAWAGWSWYRHNYSSVVNFEQCEKAGYEVQTGVPRICSAKGKHFTEQ